MGSDLDCIVVADSMLSSEMSPLVVKMITFPAQDGSDCVLDVVHCVHSPLGYCCVIVSIPYHC